MKDRSASRKPGTSASGQTVTGQCASIDFQHLLDCAKALDADLDEDRARVAGISLATYYRIKRGKANLKMTTVSSMATNLRTSAGRLMGLTS